MKYYSTRDKSLRMDAAEAIKMGLSRDGGLLTPETIPQVGQAFCGAWWMLGIRPGRQRLWDCI